MITTITGENDFVRRQELKRRVDAFVAEHGDIECEQIDGEEADASRMEGVLLSLPFFSDKKCIVLDMPSKQKDFLERAPEILEQVADNVDVIIHEPKLDNRSRYAKYVRASTDLVQCDELAGADVVDWLIEQAKRRGATLSQQDASYLMQRVGEQQFLLLNELEKLTIHNPDITREHIDALVESRPQSTIFELLDAAFSGAQQKALDTYQQQRLQNVEPQVILHMMARQLHLYALILHAPSGMSDQDLAKEIRQHPYAIKKARQATRQLSPTKIKELIAELRRIDEAAKTSSIDLDQALQNYIVSIAYT